MSFDEILKKLPYTKPFLFVDELTELSGSRVVGSYRFKETEFFYSGHFKNNPVTPGVILTECMAQIGLVCLGIYLSSTDSPEENLEDSKPKIALSETKINFSKPVFPGEKVIVTAEKDYFRFNKLQCKVKMHNEKEELVCSGTISGMLIRKDL